MDAAVGAAAALAGEGALSAADENAIVDAAVGGDPRVLVLARHYSAAAPRRFAEHALRAIRSGPPPAMMMTGGGGGGVTSSGSSSGAGGGGGVDAVVVGGGLAGLTAALTLLDRGARVVLVEKEPFVGGNSQWASSGINGVDTANATNPDSVAAFTEDCEKSSLGGGEGAATGATIGPGPDGGDSSAAAAAGDDAAEGGGGGPSPESVEHIPVLASGSVETLEWLKNRVGVDLSRTGQLGGHSFPRTHRPASGMAGSTLVLALQKACDAYKASGALVVRKKTKVEEVLMDDATGAVRGVRWSAVTTTKKQGQKSGGGGGRGGDTGGGGGGGGGGGVDIAHAVILATGGFANDRDGEDSLLRRYAPGAVRFATTNTRWGAAQVASS
jgi:succinate dehydrogenase/fumarate reductase flavoprotein subunit